MSARAITSLANPLVKAARALHMRKARQESGLFLAEGLKLVLEAVELGRTPRTVLYAAEAAALPAFRRMAEATAAAGGQLVEVSHAILEKVSRRD
ncbi:MAG TPA: RNA methyltransferase, partial [Caulobacteraceae bacterium]|nr:RNA methyltransferase [Caulobacteraceae bacterium]